MIKFTNVFKAFPKGGLALKDVSFHIAKGEFVFLTGHSGAGKSTVLKLVYADEPVTSGEVRVSGFNVAELRPRDVPMLRRRLGIVFQDFRLLEDRTAEENVAFALEVTGARRSSIPARVVGRRAAAGCHRTRARERAERAARRRADGQPGRAGHARRVPAAARHQRQRHRRRHGHARSRPRAPGAVPRDRAPGGGAGVRLGRGRAPRPGGDAVNLTIREALLAFRRAPLLSTLSVTTIAFSLFVVGLFGLVAVNLQDALRGVAERVEIVAYLLPGTPIETITLAEKDIEAFPEVQAAAYVSEDSALARARAELVEFRDVLQELERNPLPASVEVKLKPRYRDVQHVNDVAERLQGFGFVDDVRFGRDWVEKLDRLRQLAAAVGVVVGGAFAAVAIIIIGTTIRMAVLQRSREIAIMRLVGATDGFIRRPFLLQGAIKGLLGGLVAMAFSYGAYYLINRFLIQATFFTQVQALAIVGFGAVIGLMGSLLSVGRHLKRV